MAYHEGTPGPDRILGTGGNDTIDGRDGDDYLSGGAGDDQLSGVDGDDTLIGGDGDDWAYGYTGDDRLDWNSGEDTLGGGDDDDISGAVPATIHLSVMRSMVARVRTVSEGDPAATSSRAGTETIGSGEVKRYLTPSSSNSEVVSEEGFNSG